MFCSSKNGVGRFFFLGFFFLSLFFLQWRATHWAFHHFIMSPNIEACIIHCMMLACHTIEVLLQGSCYPTNLFFLFLLAKVPLLGACFIWSSNNNNHNNKKTYLHFKASEHKNGFASLSCATTWIMGCFLARAQESQVHPYSFGPPTSLPSPLPTPNFIDLSLII